MALPAGKIITKEDMRGLQTLALALARLKTPEETVCFLKEILTVNEFKNLSRRWRLLEMLQSGASQRDIAKRLQISLCKITRGSKILRTKKSVTKKILT